MHQMFCLPNAGEICKLDNHRSLDFCFRKTAHEFQDAIVFETQLRFQNVSRPHEDAKPALSNTSALKSVQFRNRFMWTLDLTVEIQLRFPISPA